MRRLTVLATFVALLGLASFAGAAAADTTGPITFDSPYVVGNINGQQGWSNTGLYDANVVSTLRFGFGHALQISNAKTSGSFGDQTFSPAVDPAGLGANSHFEASFRIGTTTDATQAGLHISVSPDNGQGARMSYLRFEDQSDGVHVFFDDVTDKGPIGTVASFNESDIATLSRTSAHTVTFWMSFNQGLGTDVVKIFIDGDKVAQGVSWKNYYRFDPEQAGGGNVVPTVSKMLFRASGTAEPTLAGQGFLIDNVTLTSS